MTKRQTIPQFKTEVEESDFWQGHDSSDFVDWSQARQARFPNLKPSTRSISLRLPESLLSDIKILANKEDVPYQSLMKLLLAQGVTHLRLKRSVV